MRYPTISKSTAALQAILAGTLCLSLLGCGSSGPADEKRAKHGSGAPHGDEEGERGDGKAGHGHGSESHEEGHAGGGDEDGESGEHAHGGGDEGEHADEVVLTTDAVKRNGIRLSVAKRGVTGEGISAPARVSFNAEQVAHVGASVAGRVTEVRAKTGDQVRAGDVLLVVDSPELGEAQSDFLQKKTAEQVSGPALSLSKNSYERVKGLFEKTQGTTLNEVQKREGEYRAAEGAALSAKSAAAAARNKLMLLGMKTEEVSQLEKTGTLDPHHAVRAPLGGEVVEREVTLGELVGPEKDKLLVVADLSTVWVVADVPEAKLASVRVGSKATLRVSTSSVEGIEGQVSYVAPSLDAATRTARVRVVVRNDERKLSPGMFATAEIQVDGAAGDKSLISIPEEALQTVEGGPAVFVPVPGEENTFQKRSVHAGTPAGGMVVVLSGLEEGEKYVSGGSFVLKAEIGKAGASHEH